MRKFLFSFCLILILPVYAFAANDIIATYKYQDGNMVTICVRDAEHVRMDTSPNSFLLLSGGKIYTVINDNGQVQVMDMDQAMGMASGFTSMFGGGKDAPKPTVQYTETGRTEKVAGYSGVVYNVKVTDGDKVLRQDEAVLSNHADLKKVNDGWAAIASHMGRMMGKETARLMDQCAEKANAAGYGGMLRYGNEMKLAGIKKESLSASYYELPADAQPMQIPSPPQEQSESGTVGRELGQDAKDIGGAARDEAKGTVADEVREGVRGVLQGLFH